MTGAASSFGVFDLRSAAASLDAKLQLFSPAVLDAVQAPPANLHCLL